MPDGTREQLFLVHLFVDGTDCGIWDAWAGGDKDTASVKYRSGGSPDEESLGGGNTFADLTLSRNYRISRDPSIERFLLSKAGIGNAVASKTVLDRSYQAQGDPLTYKGLLKTVTPPNTDSNSTNPAIISVVIEPNSIA